MDSSPKEKLALRELDDNVAWMRTIFQHYLSWYTFFITANLFVLSWVFTKDVKQGTLPLAILFVFLNVCGAVTAALLARYISDANKRNRVLVERVNALAGLEDDEGMRPTFPDALARVGFIFISLGLIGIAGLWIAAGVYF